MRDDLHDRPIGHSNTCVRNQTKLIPWIREGVVAEGAITLLSAAEKVGKTTLLSLLLARRRGGGQGTTRRRTFTGVGRYPETLQSARAGLNPEGTDYLLLPDSPTPPPPLLGIVQALLAESPTPLTGRELLAPWPGAVPCPNRLWRTLTRGIERGLFTLSGAGTKTDAFCYGVAVQTKVTESAGPDQQAAADAG